MDGHLNPLAIRTMNEIMQRLLRSGAHLLLLPPSRWRLFPERGGIYGVVPFAVTVSGDRRRMLAPGRDLAILVLRRGARPLVAGIVVRGPSSHRGCSRRCCSYCARRMRSLGS